MCLCGERISWEKQTPFSRRPRPRAVKCRVLDRRLRLGEGSTAGVPWGEGLGKGDLGRRRHNEIWANRALFSCGQIGKGVVYGTITIAR